MTKPKTTKSKVYTGAIRRLIFVTYVVPWVANPTPWLTAGCFIIGKRSLGLIQAMAKEIPQLPVPPQEISKFIEEFNSTIS